jgi:alkylation response protein AidB-like acyl-CoA dehydrogenase
VSAPPVTLDLLAAAQELADEIAGSARRSESARALPDTLVGRLREARLYSMCLPKALGGLESGPRVICDVIEELSRADSATGWNVLIGNTSAFLAWLDPDTAAAMVERTPEPILAGSMAPLGKGEVVEGGFQVSGQWPFASGCANADWLMGGFVVTEGGAPRRLPSGAPEMRVAFFPADQLSIVDTWHVAGLLGTGSHDVRAQEVHVPAERTAVPFFEGARQPGPLYQLSPYNVLMVLLAGFPLGTARRALDELIVLATGKVRAGARAPLIEDPLVTTRVLAAEASLHAAREGVRAAFTDAWATLESGRGLEPRQRAAIAAATIHAFDVGRAIVDEAFHAAGASALYDDHPLQRCLRDLHAAGQHIAFSADARGRLSRTLLGLPTPPAIFQV